jgi:chromosome segregation ATPase
MSLDALTQGTVDGNGVFDRLMQSVRTHLDAEYKKNRINGEEYAKVYTQLTTTVLQQSIQFMLSEPTSTAQVALLDAQKDQVHTQTSLIATQRQNAVIEGENLTKQGVLLDKQALSADAETSRIQAQTSQIDQQTANLVLEADNIPKQGLILTAQKANTEAQTTVVTKNAAMVEQQILNLGAENANLVTQNSVLLKQIAKTEADITLVNAQVTQSGKEAAFTEQRTSNLSAEALNIPKQGLILDKQLTVLDEQVLASAKGREQADAQIALTNAQKLKVDSDVDVNDTNILKANKEIEVLDQRKRTEQAQISDTVDGATVTGILGKQRELYGQQIEGYKRDAEQKVLKTVADVWSVMRTTDNGQSPDAAGFTSAKMTSIVNKAASGIGV